MTHTLTLTLTHSNIAFCIEQNEIRQWQHPFWSEPARTPKRHTLTHCAGVSLLQSWIFILDMKCARMDLLFYIFLPLSLVLPAPLAHYLSALATSHLFVSDAINSWARNSHVFSAITFLMGELGAWLVHARTDCIIGGETMNLWRGCEPKFTHAHRCALRIQREKQSKRTKWREINMLCLAAHLILK